MICVLVLLSVIYFQYGHGGVVLSVSANEKQKTVEAHNRYRIEAQATAMQKMKWDKNLTKYAEKAASGCNYKHTTNEARKNVAGFSYIGENMYTRTGTGNVTRPTIMHAVKKWCIQEKEDYDLESNKCNGPQCGHYTQIVWSSTVYVGCGIARCKNVASFTNQPGYLIYCNYGEGGNIKGQRPYEKTGSKKEIGSKCKEKFGNSPDNTGLCVREDEQC